MKRTRLRLGVYKEKDGRFLLRWSWRIFGARFSKLFETQEEMIKFVSSLTATPCWEPYGAWD